MFPNTRYYTLLGTIHGIISFRLSVVCFEYYMFFRGLPGKGQGHLEFVRLFSLRGVVFPKNVRWEMLLTISFTLNFLLFLYIYMFLEEGLGKFWERLFVDVSRMEKYVASPFPVFL